MIRPLIHMVSMSGGKDSTATALLALALQDPASCRFVFCDTGNEHPMTVDYVAYLADALSIEIVTLRQDFTEWWWRRRDYVLSEWPKKGVPDDAVRRVAAFMERGPTGNPFLDLCIIKGRFPSRRMQFCTQFLKTDPMTEFAVDMLDAGFDVWSWQGVRADESEKRAKLKPFDEVGGGLWNHRPILRWKASDCFEAMRYCGIKPNPLYSLGQDRVGCMPCINSQKGQLRRIAQRFPEHVDRIEEWESIVAMASKAGAATFFSSPAQDNRGEIMGSGILDVVRWSKTSRGGRQFDLLITDHIPACESSYGLCE